MAYEYSYDDCKPPAKVVVNGNDIPVINKGITSRARIDGPLDINRLTEVYFPIEWDGHDITKAIKALDLEGSSVWEPVDVKLLDPETGNYYTYHRGLPLGIGAGSKGSLERKMRIGDPGQLFSGIPFSGNYANDATLGDILSDVISKFDENQDVFDTTHVAKIDEILNQDRRDQTEIGEDGIIDAITDIYSPDQIFGRAKSLSDEATTHKKFKKNRDTLQSAIDYVTRKLDGELYFIPTGATPGEIGLAYNENRETDFYAKNADGSNANASPTVMKNAEDEAVEVLISEIENGGTGEIVTRLFPFIKPHDNIYTKPACGSNVAQDVHDIGYTVNEVTHRIGFDQDINSFYQKTHLRVNTHISPKDITVTSTMKQV